MEDKTKLTNIENETKTETNNQDLELLELKIKTLTEENTKLKSENEKIQALLDEYRNHLNIKTNSNQSSQSQPKVEELKKNEIDFDGLIG